MKLVELKKNTFLNPEVIEFVELKLDGFQIEIGLAHSNYVENFKNTEEAQKRFHEILTLLRF